MLAKYEWSFLEKLILEMDFKASCITRIYLPKLLFVFYFYGINFHKLYGIKNTHLLSQSFLNQDSKYVLTGSYAQGITTLS